MSTSGGTSGGAAGFPITLDDGTYTYTVTAVGGILTVDVVDDATGNFEASAIVRSQPGAQIATARLIGSSAVHDVTIDLTANDVGASAAALRVDAKGLTIDANGNPVWSGTLPPAPLLVATAHLNAAAIGTMFSAPTLIVAAPGANKAIVPVGGFLEFVAGTCGYISQGGDGLHWGAPLVSTLAAGDSMLDRTTGSFPTASRVVPIVPFPNPAKGVLRAVAANAALNVGANTGNPDRYGPILTATVANGGTLYAVGDTGTIGPDSNTGDTTATYVVNTVDVGTGAVLTFTITNGGASYSLIDNPQPTATGGAQPGVGGGFTLNVATIHAADGDLYVTVVYQVVALH